MIRDLTDGAGRRMECRRGGEGVQVPAGIGGQVKAFLGELDFADDGVVELVAGMPARTGDGGVMPSRHKAVWLSGSG